MNKEYVFYNFRQDTVVVKDSNRTPWLHVVKTVKAQRILHPFVLAWHIAENVPDEILNNLRRFI